jgi:hypothetical protein
MKCVAATETRQSATSHPSTATLKHGPSATAWRRAHEKMKADDGLWVALLFDGIQHDSVGGLLENRRCPCCGSVLSRRTTALHAVGIVASLAEVHARSLDAIVKAGDAAQRVEAAND